tara:strand:- start:174 stop:500 length:327 start_codon:yes stop_codon:yes gene_type:complete
MGRIKNKKYCCWCSKETHSEKIMLPETPILEFLEKKIDSYGRNRIWGVDGDWSNEIMDSDFEAELLIYDQMLNNIDLRLVCDKCMEEDNKLWDKYYGNEFDFEFHLES